MKLKHLFSKHRTAELVIKRRTAPHTKLFIAGVVMALLLVAGGAIYQYGLSAGGIAPFAFERQSALREEVKRLKDENLDLRETLARAQRTLQTDQVAYQDLDRRLKSSDREINRLREELSFYRNIISPSGKVSGLQVERLNVERAAAKEGDGAYRYKLVLIQALKHDSTIYGRVQLNVAGAQDGRDAVLTFPSADRPHNINFKYFQEFEGVMKLPRNFYPTGIKVTITTTAPAAQTLEQNYSWPKL
jgi:hypothetical protein